MSVRTDRISTETLRIAFERSGLTTGDVARRMGWMRPDHQRVLRQLGMLANSNSRGSIPRTRQSVSYGRALELITAMGFDPVDFDL